MQPNQSTGPNSIVHPSDSPTGGGATIVGGGTTEADGKKDISLGIMAMVLGILLPFVGLAIAVIMFIKGMRQSRRLLILFGVVGLVTTLVGVFIYIQIYKGIAQKPRTSSQVQSPNAEEANPDGFDSLGIQ